MPTPGACASSPAAGLGVAADRRPRLLDRASSASRCRWCRIESGIPKLAAAARAPTRGGAAAADAMLTTDTVRKEAYAEAELGRRVAAGRRHGEGRGDARARDGDDARRRHDRRRDRRRARCTPRSSTRSTTRSTRSSSTGARSTNDTVLVLANGAAANGRIETPGGPGLRVRGGADRGLRRARGADGRRRRGRDEVRARRRARRPLGRRGPTRGQGGRRAASSSSARCYGGDPYWGRVLSELGASGAVLDPDRVDIAYNGITVCRDGVAVAHDETALEETMAGRDIEIVCDLHEGRGEATVRFTDLTHALHRREHGDELMSATVRAAPSDAGVAAGRPPEGRDPGRGAAVHPRVRGPTVVIKYGGHAMEDPALADLSRRTSCSCASSA